MTSRVRDGNYRFERLQREQEGFRLALMGDAVAVAASAVFFAVRLVDATFDLYISSALYGGSNEDLRQAAEKYQTFLAFKASEELRSMAISLVLPLLLMRTLGAVKDVLYSVWFGEGNTARKVLDMIDIGILSLTVSYSYSTIPLLESGLRALTVSGNAWEHKAILDAFDGLEFSHLVALAQAGLLMLVSLLKLSARLERSSVRVLERASEMDSLERLYTERVNRIEQDAKDLALRNATSVSERAEDVDSSTSASAQSSPLQEEVIKQRKQQQRQLDKAARVTPILESSSNDVPSSSGLEEKQQQQENVSNDIVHEKQQVVTDEPITNMESDDFYKVRGWKRVPLPATSADAEKNTDVMGASKHQEGESMSASDVLLGFAVSIATFVGVQKLHDPVVKILKS